MSVSSRYTTALVFLLVFLCPFSGVRAAEEFVISDIRVEGLERISPGTVFNYLPIQVGDQFDDTRSQDAVRALFKTGFFDDVRLEREGNVLVFILEERPAIGSITVTGNNDIKTEDMLESLEQIGFSEGQVFQQAMLERVEQELRQQYFSYGKYGATIIGRTEPLEDNRVAVSIEIFEGEAARIKRINIIGNSVWEEDELLELFRSRTAGWLSFITRDDQYSRQRLAADLETLHSHYMDNGYLNFNVDSTQISITPNKEHIYISINITEGEQFTVSEVQLAGTTILPESELMEMLQFEVGDIFSRKEVSETSRLMAERLGREGYAFANINSIPDIDNDNRTVALTLFIDPGKRVYVRRINFSGNVSTRDEVLRREMRQQESAWASSTQIERGRVRLQRTGFFRTVEVETLPVPGIEDQVDLNYRVDEQPSGTFNFGLGFSQEQSFIIRTSIAQNNFLGSGKHVSFAFNNSDVHQSYQLGYANPYYTVDGVSRGFNVFYRRTDAQDANVNAYDSEELGGNVNFGFPVSEYNTVYLSLEYSNIDITSPTTTSDSAVQQFVRREGTSFNLLSLISSFRYDTRNRVLLPDSGVLGQIRGEISMPGFSDSLQYYKVDVRGQWLQDIYRNFVLSLRGDMGYGDGYSDTESLPFFKNFYLGGPNSVRGYRANTLGPRDVLNQPTGGNFKVNGSLEVILPLPFLRELQNSARITTFLDGGNVYDTEDIRLSNLRYSAGLGGIWISPFGQISISVAVPLNDKPGDSTQQFQFNFGTGF